MTQCAPNAKTGARTCWSYRSRGHGGPRLRHRLGVDVHDLPKWHFKALVSLTARPRRPP